MQNNFMSSFVLSVGIMVAGALVGRGFVEFKKADNAIDVRGLSERIVKADKANVQLSFSVTGNDVQSVYPGVSKSQNEIIAFLQKQGFSEDEIERGQISLSDNQANSYSTSKGPRFTARSSVSVSTAKIDAAIKTAEGAQNLLQKGVAVESVSRQFFYTNLNSIKPEMLKEATQNARAAAESLAADSKVKLGRLKNATQGLFSIEDAHGTYDSGLSVNKKVRVVTQTTFAIE